MLTFHRRRSGLRRDVMTAQMPASGLKQAGSMKVITNLSKCGLMTDSGLYHVPSVARVSFRVIGAIVCFHERRRNVINHAPTPSGFISWRWMNCLFSGREAQA